MDEKPLPGTKAHAYVGLVTGTTMEQGALHVSWLCPPERDLEPVLKEGGLPVNPVQQDTVTRVGRCIGAFAPGDTASWNPSTSWLDLLLMLGSGDGVHAGDRYEVLGKPIVDDVNRTVTGFEENGSCFVQPQDLGVDHSTCRVDRKAKDFRMKPDDFVRGGFLMVWNAEHR